MIRLSLLLALLGLAIPAHAQHSYLELSDYCKRGDWMDYTLLCKQFHLEQATFCPVFLADGLHWGFRDSYQGMPACNLGGNQYPFPTPPYVGR